MHLTDEQLNEYLDYESSERNEIEAHVSSCAECAARLSVFQALFDEIESLPELALSHSVAARLLLPSTLPAKLPRSLNLTVTMQAALATLAIILAAPFVTQFISPYVLELSAPSMGDAIVQVQLL